MASLIQQTLISNTPPRSPIPHKKAKQQQNPAELHHSLNRNLPILTPPVFSSMAAETIMENCLCRANPPTGCPAVCSYPRSSFSSLSTGQQFNTSRATHRHSGTVHSTVHWTTLGEAHWESQQGLGKQLSFLSLCTLFFSYSSAPLSFTVPTSPLSLSLSCQGCLHF